jgi:hypothetical protein
VHDLRGVHHRLVDLAAELGFYLSTAEADAAALSQLESAASCTDLRG